MEIAVGAKSTKPGSKANARRGQEGGRGTRVPVGTLHVIDLDAQTSNRAMFDAICGETALMSIDGSWDDDFPNERCVPCSEKQWMTSFDAMQANLLG